MVRHIQRKCFDSPDLAAEAAQAFRDFDPSLVGARASVKAVEKGGAFWVYVIHEGDRVSGTEPLLPGYERVL